MDPAFLLGMILAKAVNPVIAVVGFLIGAVTTRWWIRVLGSILVGAAGGLASKYVDIGVQYHDDSVQLAVATIGATLLWACLGWAAKLAMRKIRHRQSSSGSA